jgi:hypothetical protein
VQKGIERRMKGAISTTAYMERTLAELIIDVPSQLEQ